MEALVSVLSGRPLRFHFSLHNDGDRAVVVPRWFGPLGAFVTAELVDADGALVYETPATKFKPKLSPTAPASYVSVEPGHTVGAVFALDVEDDLDLKAGLHRLDLTYSNLQYRGYAGNDFGSVTVTASVELELT